MTAGLSVMAAGCASGPLQENPLVMRFDRLPPPSNPVYVPQGPMAYHRVFEKAEDVLSDYFVISYSNRFDGRIETQASIAPGIEQPWKPGSPDLYQRMLAFFQTIRHRAIVQITTADDGGYFVDVKVLKELEDLSTPTRINAGSAVYRIESTVQREYEIVQPNFFDSNWIPIGRDACLEQVILERLARMDVCRPVR